MSGFFFALQFLSRLPAPARVPFDESQLGHSARWFPLVGALLGAIVGAIDYALAGFAGGEVRAIVAVIAFAALSGALHLDGLMDSCDGLLAFASPERRLEIMRDSRVGSFAIVGAATLLILKYAAFLGLPAEHRFAGFVAIGAASRWAMVYAGRRYPTARPEGLAHTFRAGMGHLDLPLATVLALILVLPAGAAGIAGFIAAWFATLLLARYTQSKIPGLTGDTHGAICEVAEVAVALVLPPLWRLLA